jgi:valyl-tRNA synthetase
LRSDYKIPNHIKADFYFQTESSEVQKCLIDQNGDFCTLAKANCLKFLSNEETAPKGCCVKVLSDQLSLLVDLTGIIDIDTEINRLAKEVERFV